jgi:hypothetical protein
VSGIGGTQAKAVRVSPRVVLPVSAAGQGLLLGTDSHYVDPVSSTKRVLALTGLAERKLTRLAGPTGLGQLQDHYHQNDNDQDANNDPNDSSVHFSSFDSHAEVILATRSR